MSDIVEQPLSERDPVTGNPMNLTCTVAKSVQDNGGPVYAIVINADGNAQPPNDGATWKEIVGFIKPTVTYTNGDTDGGNFSYDVPAGGIAIYHKVG